MAYGHGFHQYSVVWPGDAVSHVVATRGRRFEPRGSYVVDPLVRWARKVAQVRCEDFALKKTKKRAARVTEQLRSASRTAAHEICRMRARGGALEKERSEGNERRKERSEKSESTGGAKAMRRRRERKNGSPRRDGE